MEVTCSRQEHRGTGAALVSAFALAIALLLGGCGDDGGGTKADTSTPPGGLSPAASATRATPTAVASPSPSPTARAASGSAYIVKAGDTLWDLAQGWGVTVEAIIAANDLASPDDLAIGQELRVP